MNATIRIAGVIASGLVLFGCAATSPNTKPAASAAVKDPSCLTDTGDLVAAGKPACRGYGRSYSKGDIDRTGATQAGDALALLDPSITVHR